MASPAQILANRHNAKNSSGPKTPEGKKAASRNATRHGLTSTQIVIPGEDAPAYEQLRQGLHDTHRPIGEAERILVDQIAANAWRLMRAQRVETAFLAKLVEGAADPDEAIADAFLEKPKELARMSRYVAAAQNAYYKAMAQLSKLRKERSIAEHEPPIGFVSYNDLREPALPAAQYAMREPSHDERSASQSVSRSMPQDLLRYSDSGQTAENYCS
jgi:hypothetical protein